jgi:hypothetical protein
MREERDERGKGLEREGISDKSGRSGEGRERS